MLHQCSQGGCVINGENPSVEAWPEVLKSRHDAVAGNDGKAGSKSFQHHHSKPVGTRWGKQDVGFAHHFVNLVIGDGAVHLDSFLT